MGFPYIRGSMIAVNYVALYVQEEILIHASLLCFSVDMFLLNTYAYLL